MLQACLNGARSKSEHRAIPISHSELSEDAAAAREAGAHELHIHPRNAHGEETLDPDEVARCVRAIRASVPGMPMGVSTGAWIESNSRKRQAQIREWEVLPDYASVNLSEDDAPETMDILIAKGVGIESGLWNRHDAERFVELPHARHCLRILVEMTSGHPGEALAEYEAVMAVLRQHEAMLPVLLHGEGGSVWSIVREAKLRGLATRVGFEDGLHLPDGSVAPNNAALVAAAAKILA